MQDKKEQKDAIKKAQALYYELREKGVSHALAMAAALESIFTQSSKDEE